MDYFQSQDVARRKTGLLVTYFILAVILIILMVYLAIQVVLGFGAPAGEEGTVGAAQRPVESGAAGSGGPRHLRVDRGREPLQDRRAFRGRAHGGRATGRPVAASRRSKP